MSEDQESSHGISLTPPELVKSAATAINNLLPKKSKNLYQNVYSNFMDWKASKNANSFSENVILAYFNEISKQLKPSTIWSRYSMLKATLNQQENVDISTYKKLHSFLKRRSEGYKAKKSKILTANQIQKFLSEAPDDTFLATKVIH